MRKIFLFLILGIFMISMASAFEFDNVKYERDVTFDGKHVIGNDLLEKYKPIEIKNAFGLGATLFEGYISKHDDVCGNDCSSTIEIKLNQDGVLINDVIFKTLQEDGGWIEQGVRSFQFYINIGSKSVDVNDYEYKCEIIGSSENGTDIEDCHNVLIGSHKEDVPEWAEYTPGEEVTKGTYQIKLEAEKKPSRTVDWIITTQGKQIGEWAIWGGTQQIGLIAYYKLDDNNFSDELGTYNGVNHDTLNSSGILIDGRDGDSDDWIGTSITGSFESTVSVNFWINPDDIIARQELLGYFDATDNQMFFDLARNNAGELRFLLADGQVSVLTAISAASYQMVTGTYDGTTMRLYVDGLSIGNLTNAGEIVNPINNITLFGANDGDPTNFGYTGLIDEVGFWNRTLTQEEITSLYNSGDAFAYPFSEGTVTLNSPVDEFVSSVNDVEFNATTTITGGSTIVNMSLWTNESGIWESKNSTVITGTTNTTTWIRTLTDTTLWGVQACDSDGDCGFSGENRTVFIDISGPVITVESPSGDLDYGVIGGNETLNVTFTDPNLDTCLYDYNGTNFTIDGCVNGVKNSTTFILEEDNFNMTVYANDTLGNSDSTFIEWNYKVIETNQTFNNMTTEGATEQFLINFTKLSSLQVSTVSLIYNGTSNSLPYSVSDDNVTSEGSITIPVITSDVNVTFFWNITFDDGSFVITESNNQTVLNIDVDDCSVFTHLIYNFTQYDEENQTILTEDNTIELQINLYDTRKTLLLANFSNKFIDVNPVQFCAESPILPTVNYSSYVVVKYFVNSTNSSKAYSVEYYNILNQTITNSTLPINIALYNLKVDDTTKFRLTFRDGEFVLAPNILVQVHRQYIVDNDFKIVEIPLTDSNGQTVLNLVKDVIVYNFVMVNENNEVVGVFNSIKAFCQDFVIGDCSINLAPDSLSEDIYDYDKEFDISFSALSYDSSTEKISMSFITGDLTPKNVRMDVVRNNPFGNRSVCSASLFAASGLLSCDVSSIVDTDQFLFISTFVEDDLAKQDTTNLNADILNFGTLNGAFFAFLFMLFMITMFMEDRKVLVVSLGLGWVGVISLGLINGRFIGFTSAGIWILISIAVFLWKLNQEESI